MKLVRAHHQAIWKILEGLNRSFLLENNILFGGGTRIAMELGEYRESVDLDLFCVGRDAYRAARSSIVNQNSFGGFFQPGHSPALYQGREIRVDRDAIRSILDGGGRPIKFEIIHFDNDDIIADSRADLFPVPFVSRESCFATKLLANADRYRDGYKDLIDLCMMLREWGEIPLASWQAAFDRYGKEVIVRSLRQALDHLISNPQASIDSLVEQMKIGRSLADTLVRETATSWRQSPAFTPK